METATGGPAPSGWVILLACSIIASCSAERTPEYYGAREEVLAAQMRENERQMRDLALEPYRRWESEEPPDCASTQLQRAKKAVRSAASLLAPREHGFDAVYESGRWILEVADGAKRQGCNDVAGELYDDIISSYTGWGYLPLRLRAHVGIEDIRQAEMKAHQGWQAPSGSSDGLRPGSE